MTTYAKLLEFASENDGSCVVAKVYVSEEDEDLEVFEDFAGPEYSIELMTEPPHRSVGQWDYFFTDEPECFDFAAYDITGAPE